MDKTKRAVLEPLFNSCDPQNFNISLFPPEGDDGEGNGSDYDLASIIEMGFDPPYTSGWNVEIGALQIEFAIKLGRALQASGR